MPNMTRKDAYPLLVMWPQQSEMLNSEENVLSAMTLTSTQKHLKGFFSFIDIRICQKNATALSALLKDIYSCKNVIQRGRKRKIFRTLFKRDASSVKQITEYESEITSTKHVQVDIERIRVAIYDSSEQEQTIGGFKKSSSFSRLDKEVVVDPGTNFVTKLANKATEELGKESGSVQDLMFKPGKLITIETGIQITSVS